MVKSGHEEHRLSTPSYAASDTQQEWGCANILPLSNAWLSYHQNFTFSWVSRLLGLENIRTTVLIRCLYPLQILYL